MYRIKTDGSYNERFASLSFVNGEATTDDPWLAAWCKGRGFQVERMPETDEAASKKQSGKRGRKDDEGKSAGEGEAFVSSGAGIGT